MAKLLTDKLTGLEGKLADVKVGDIIRLWHDKPGDSKKTYSVAGYVLELGTAHVVLGIEHPLRRPNSDCHTDMIRMGNKNDTFPLSLFKEYRLLVDQNPHNNYSNLRSCLSNVRNGDLIRIWKLTPGNSRNDYEAAGYVYNVGERTVTLGIHHPVQPLTFGLTYDFITQEERKYRLYYFESYATLIDAPKPKTEITEEQKEDSEKPEEGSDKPKDSTIPGVEVPKIQESGKVVADIDKNQRF